MRASASDRLETERLVLRRWHEGDRAGFAAMNADPQVMEHFPSVYTRERSDMVMDAIEQGFEAHGFGLWALEERASGALLGMAGLQHVPFLAPFTPAVEVGWRLVPSAWGRGFATEAATAALAHGFEAAGLAEIVAMTAPANTRSQAVMRTARNAPRSGGHLRASPPAGGAPAAPPRPVPHLGGRLAGSGLRGALIAGRRRTRGVLQAPPEGPRAPRACSVGDQALTRELATRLLQGGVGRRDDQLRGLELVVGEPRAG